MIGVPMVRLGSAAGQTTPLDAAPAAPRARLAGDLPAWVSVVGQLSGPATRRVLTVDGAQVVLHDRCEDDDQRARDGTVAVTGVVIGDPLRLLVPCGGMRTAPNVAAGATRAALDGSPKAPASDVETAALAAVADVRRPIVAGLLLAAAAPSWAARPLDGDAHRTPSRRRCTRARGHDGGADAPHARAGAARERTVSVSAAYTPARSSTERTHEGRRRRVDPASARPTHLDGARNTTSASNEGSWPSTSCWSATLGGWRRSRHAGRRWSSSAEPRDHDCDRHPPRHAHQLHVDRHGHRQRRDRAGRGDGDHRRRPTFIRVGSSGALQPEIALGDLIVSIGASAWRTRPTSTSSRLSPRSPIATSCGRSKRRCRRSRVPVPRGADRRPPAAFTLRRDGRCARSQFAILSSLTSCAASVWRISRWNPRHSSCWQGLRDCGRAPSARPTRSGRRHVPGRRGKGGRGGTLHRCRTGRHPPALAGRHRGGGDPAAASGSSLIGRGRGASQLNRPCTRCRTKRRR